MCGSGYQIGMAVIPVAHRQIHRDRKAVFTAFFAAAVGAATAPSVGLPIATGAIRTAGSTTAAFVWFVRRTRSTLSPNSAIAEF